MRIVYRPKAVDDVLEARRWYESEQDGLGTVFEKAVKATISIAGEFPLAGFELIPDVRRLVVRGFPFVVLYSVEDERIVVFRVVHGRLDPNSWQREIS